MQTTKQAGRLAVVKITVLMASIAGLLALIGYLAGGLAISLLFLVVACAFNFLTCMYSDRIAVKMSGAESLHEEEAPKLFEMIRELSDRAAVPMPRVYLIHSSQANAFAAGRSPKVAVIAVTSGLVNRVSDSELRGVIAHELAHIKRRDILTNSVAAAMGAAITYLGYLALSLSGRDSLIGVLAMTLLAPVAATVIQLAISRQQEFGADAQGAAICGNPEGLASALLRLQEVAADNPMEVNEAAAPMYIVAPLRTRLSNIFATHPPTEERIKRLREMRPAL